MKKKMQSLSRQREKLIEKIAAQRASLANEMNPWQTRFHRIDQGISVLKFLKNHPALTFSGGLLIQAVGTTRMGKWLRVGWLAWQIAKKFRNHKS